MNNVIPLDDYIMSDRNKIEYGMERLDEALSYFDDVQTFEGRNLASLIYIALKYAENIDIEKI